MSFCTNCGKALSTGAKFCPSCGRPVATAVRPSVPVPVQDPPAFGQPSLASISSPSPAGAPAPGGRKIWKVFSALAALSAAIFLYLFVDHLPGKPHRVIEKQPGLAFVYPAGVKVVSGAPIDVMISTEEVTFPVETLRNQRMVEFDFATGSNVIPLLAYVNNEGKLVTSIRLCEPCNAKSFTIEGDELHCGNCETAWSLRTLDGLQGTCQQFPPDPIPSIVRDGLVVIKISSIINWKIRI